MAELRHWRIFDDWGTFIAKGIVYGKPSVKFSDGIDIRTSPIQSAEFDDSGVRIKTRNTLYFLDKNQICINQNNESVEAFAKAFFKDDADLFLSKICEWREPVLRRFMKSGRLLSPDNVYLELSSAFHSFFNDALYKDKSGHLYIEIAHNHVGTFEDSVILQYSGVRWFPEDHGVRFYNTFYIDEPPKTMLKYLKNVGTDPIEVTFTSDKKILLQPGELFEVEQSALLSEQISRGS